MDVARRQLSADGLRCLGFVKLALDPAEYGPDYRYAAEGDEARGPNFPIGDRRDEARDGDGRVQDPRSRGGLVFLRLTALIDPPHPAVPGANEKCKTRASKVIVVTGDHPVKTQAIARRVGILWSKTRRDMERDNAQHRRAQGETDYEDPAAPEVIVMPGHALADAVAGDDVHGIPATYYNT